MSERMVSDLELIHQLIEAGAEIVRRGLALASGGNVSARTKDGVFVVSRAGAWLDQMSVDDFAIMSMDGQWVSGASPSSEWRLHQRTYQVRPDARAVVHVHPQHAVLLDALRIPIRLLTLDHAFYVRSIGRTDYYPNGSQELADSAAEQARGHDCVVLGHHGCSTTGETVSMALRRALNLEEAATATYRALLLGDTGTTFPPAALASLHHSSGEEPEST
ncbi:class II aldolase/adducin family protein [Microbacterium sp. Au-Mic1]|uniref:class II aldolase/adducin family protein n=1 Tax=Microbacterium sp. Au-Mic1 TaxID=2906457 RepID=UPI001E496CDA|nr:class II aldolase/adducin family protein [Microbacterium sp. Au-Mic1]MCE4025511.1 class II aldolase/adducin family protein [Microbacterium sp. Au-Mic1]